MWGCAVGRLGGLQLCSAPKGANADGDVDYCKCGRCGRCGWCGWCGAGCMCRERGGTRVRSRPVREHACDSEIRAIDFLACLACSGTHGTFLHLPMQLTSQEEMEIEDEVGAEAEAEATMDCSGGAEHTAEMHQRVLWRLMTRLVKEHSSVTEP